MTLDFDAVSPSITVNSYSTGLQRAPSIASLSDNRTIILWEDRSGQDTSSSGIFGQILDGSLSKIGTEFLVPVDTFNWQTVPKIVSDGDTSILANWSAKISRVMNFDDSRAFDQFYIQPVANTNLLFGNDGNFMITAVHQTGILQSTISAEGEELGTIKIDLQHEGVVKNLSSAVTNDGNIVHVWQGVETEGYPDAVGKDIFALVVDTSGNIITEDFKLNSYLPGEQVQPKVSLLSTGNLLAVWESIDQDGSGKGLYGQIFAQNGELLGPEFRISDETLGSQQDVAIAGLHNGNFLVVYEDSSSQSQIIAREFSDTGVSIGDSHVIGINGDTEDSFSPSLSVRTDGSVVVTWETGLDIKAVTIPVSLPVGVTFDRINGTVNENSYDASYSWSHDLTGDVKYALDGFDSAYFDLNPNTGELSLNQQANFEFKSSFDVTLIAYKTDVYTEGLSIKTLTSANTDSFKLAKLNFDVLDQNETPSFTSVPSQLAVVGREYFIPMQAVDEDTNDTLTFSAQGLPDWLEYNENTASIFGTPALADIGTYTFALTVSDAGGLQETHEVSLDVQNQRSILDIENIFNNKVVNSGNQGLQRNSDIAVINEDELIIVWEDRYGHDGSYGGVYGQKLDLNLNAVGQEFLIPEAIQNWQHNPKIYTSDDGEFLITWISSGILKGRTYDSLTLEGEDEIIIDLTRQSDFLTKFGVKSAELLLPNVSDPRSLSFSHIYDGHYALTWEIWQTESNTFPDVEGKDVYAQVFNQDDIAVSTIMKLNEFTSGNQAKPKVASLSNGNFVSVWESYGQDGDLFGVFGQIFDRVGTKLGPQFQVSNDTVGHQHDPSVIGLDTGNFLVVFENRSIDTSLVVAQEFSALGERIGAPIPIGDNYIGNFTEGEGAFNPEIAKLNDGSVVITWAVPSNGSSDISASIIPVRDQSALYVQVEENSVS